MCVSYFFVRTAHAIQNLSIQQGIRGDPRCSLISVFALVKETLEGLIAKDRILSARAADAAAPNQSQTDPAAGVVIGRYTPPEGSRRYFGSLLVGYHGPGALMSPSFV